MGHDCLKYRPRPFAFGKSLHEQMVCDTFCLAQSCEIAFQFLGQARGPQSSTPAERNAHAR